MSRSELCVSITDPDSTVGGLREHLCEGDLRAGVEVHLGLFDVDELILARDEQRHEDGETLRYAEADIGDVHQIPGASPGSS